MGTKQIQLSSGDLQCVPVDAPAASIDCSVDAGDVVIVGGHCVSRIMCDPGTTMAVDQNGNVICTGTGGAGCPPCPTPAAGKICVSGKLYNWADQKDLSTGGGPNLRVAAYEPLAFLGDPTVAPLAEDVGQKGCFTFPDLPAPASRLIAIAVGDPKGTMPLQHQLAGVGAQITPGQAYKVDAFVVPKALVDGWSSTAGMNYDASGIYLGCFYDDPVPDPTMLSFVETHPIAGVKLVDIGGGGVIGNARFLDPDRSTLSATLSATGAPGCAIAPPPSGVTVMSGMGGTCSNGPCAWEKHPGGSAPHVVFVERFRNCAVSPAGRATCQ
jgi:hypothetical protein